MFSWNKYRVLFLILGGIGFIVACHPKISPRLNDQSESASPITTKKNGETTVEEVIEVVQPVDEKRSVPRGPYVMLRLEKTACYGECPIFELTIYSNGKALWHGMHYCNRLGYYETFLHEVWREQLMDRAAAIQFFSLLDHYPAIGPYLSDLPNTIIYLNDGVKEKSISQNYLSPLKLINYEKEILKLAEKLNWNEISSGG